MRPNCNKCNVRKTKNEIQLKTIQSSSRNLSVMQQIRGNNVYKYLIIKYIGFLKRNDYFGGTILVIISNIVCTVCKTFVQMYWLCVFTRARVYIKEAHLIN